MENKFEILNSEQGDLVIDIDGHLLKLSQLNLALANLILENGGLYELNSRLDDINSRGLPSIKETANWLTKGVDCQILKPGKNWQKGKFRMKVNLEFCPDEPEIIEPESPLDDLRRKINEATS
jgi:hypothetical protein